MPISKKKEVLITSSNYQTQKQKQNLAYQSYLIFKDNSFLSPLLINKTIGKYPLKDLGYFKNWYQVKKHI